MDRQELETYQVQLAQVKTALTADPSNAELSSLCAELEQLITLTETALAETADPTPSSSTPKERKSTNGASAPSWKAGDECLARYSRDDKWYPARITSVGGSAEHRVYSVVFKGYNTTELLSSTAIKALSASSAAYMAATTALGKRKLTPQEEEEKERKKKKNEKKVEAKAAKAKEQLVKQAQWQKFAKKQEKKGNPIAGISGTSIFKTPDNPLGKVGVTGSGKGMTEVNGTRKKHVFAADAEDR